MKKYDLIRRGAVALAAAVLLGMTALPVLADAAPENGRTLDIGVSLTWDHGTASQSEQATAATFLLEANGATVATLTLREDDLDGESGAWSGSFKNVPAYDDNGDLIAYTVRHDVLENYDTEVLAQPKIRGFSAAFSNARKILMPGETVFTDKLMVCVIGKSFYVWTADELFGEEKDAVIEAVNASRPGDITFDMTKNNSYFFFGETDEMNIRGSVMRFTKKDGGYTVTLHDNRVWKHYYTGTFTLPYATDAVFIDTYREPEPIVTEPIVTEPPVTEPIVTEPPVTEPIVTEPPVTEPIVTEPTTVEPPVIDPPLTNEPTTDEPVTDFPITDEPVTEPPIDDPTPPRTSDSFGAFLAVALLALTGGAAAALLRKDD